MRLIILGLVTDDVRAVLVVKRAKQASLVPWQPNPMSAYIICDKVLVCEHSCNYSD